MSSFDWQPADGRLSNLPPEIWAGARATSPHPVGLLKRITCAAPSPPSEARGSGVSSRNSKTGCGTCWGCSRTNARRNQDQVTHQITNLLPLLQRKRRRVPLRRHEGLGAAAEVLLQEELGPPVEVDAVRRPRLCGNQTFGRVSLRRLVRRRQALSRCVEAARIVNNTSRPA